ncbi:prepilin peptidase [Rubripirellula lacrimiformis]|uniref:prepilin peptidase n=1 Tax=Rubripirellula lacrimiformis TaxID=1930273 RepID=UPI0011AB0480|nr:prepilin peptidase [Rubripirellula lacrimiformis]
MISLVGVVFAVAAYIFGLSAWQAAGTDYYQSDDLIIPRTIDVIVFLWCFWVGSSIGSFLNVVVWRMPRGQGVNGRSYCPRCHAQLKARDNFPVFGWLALGGKCRSCRLPISPRYPIVEGIVGASLTLVAIGQLYQLSLPGQSTHWHGGPLWAPVVDTPVLVVLLFHGFGLAVSWAMGLIRMDRNTLPVRLVQIGLGVVAVAILALPPLMIVTWQMVDGRPLWTGSSIYVDALVRVLTSIAAAVMIGRSLAPAFCPAADPKTDPLGNSTRRLIDLIAIITLPSLVVGWKTVIAVTVVATILAVPIRRWVIRSTDGLGAFAIAMPIVLTLQLFAWRMMESLSWWPGSFSGPWVILGWAGAILLVPLWIRDRDAAGTLPPVSDEDSFTDEDDDDDEENDEDEAL